MSTTTVSKCILYGDMVGSTEKSVEDEICHNAMQIAFHECWRTHLLKDSADFYKSLGDGFLATFPDPIPCVLTIVETWKCWNAEKPASSPALRLGLHFGSVLVHEDRDITGRDAALAKRIESAANPDQLLVSEEFAGRIRPYLPTGLVLHDSGNISIKSFEKPVRVSCLSAPGLALCLHPPPTRGIPTNLTASLDSFVGRVKEQKELRRLLSRKDTHCITLIGPAGCGKTRLAREVGWTVMAAFPQGIHFVSLEKTEEAESILTRIAEAVGLSLSPNASVLYNLQQRLMGRRLLILDNFDEATALAEQTVVPLLQAQRELRILATSRVALHCEGEYHYDLEPLPTPSAPSSLSKMRASASVQLFVERAKAANRRFRLTQANASQVAALCEAASGLPFGIELFAALTRYRRLEDIRADYRRDLMAIESLQPGLPAPQRSLRALFDTSYAQLSELDRTLFLQLSLFETAFSENNVYDVCTGSHLSEGLDRLYDRSLLRYDPDNAERPYHLLGILREYARCRLGEPEPALRRRFAGAFLRRAKDLYKDYTQNHERQALRGIQAELENLRVAWNWAKADEPPEVIAAFGLAVTYFAPLLPRSAQLDDWAEETERALLRCYEDCPTADKRQQLEPDLARLYNTRARIARIRERHREAIQHQQNALHWHEKIGNPASIADAHSTMARFALLAWDYRLAEDHARLGIEWGERAGDKESQAVGFCVLASCLVDEAPDIAQACAEQSLRLFREAGELLGISHAYLALAEIAVKQGKFNLAASLYREALRYCTETGLDVQLGRYLEIIGKFCAQTGRCDLADELLRAAVEAQKTLGLRETAQFALRADAPASRSLSIAEAVEKFVAASGDIS